MPIIEISNFNQSGAALFANLTDAQMRSRQEPEKGIFISEGPKVTLSALDAGCEPISLLMRRKFVDGLGEKLIRRCGDIPVYTADDDTLSALTGFRLQRSWVLCAMKRPAPMALDETLCGAKRVALLEGITEPSNVGAIFRSAAALGADAILLSPSCCDPLHRRAVRVCMGAVFQVKWARAGLDEIFPLLREEGFTTLGLALRDGCLTLDDPGLASLPKICMCFGTEDTGLTDAVLNQCDKIVKIPMKPGIDSLNVAAAAAVAFWQLRPRGLKSLSDSEGRSE